MRGTWADRKQGQYVLSVDDVLNRKPVFQRQVGTDGTRAETAFDQQVSRFERGDGAAKDQYRIELKRGGQVVRSWGTPPWGRRTKTNPRRRSLAKGMPTKKEIEAVQLVRAIIEDPSMRQYLKKHYQRQHDAGAHPHTGFCSMASDALRRILGGQVKGFRGYKLCRVVHENEPHYYLTTPAGKVLDPTSAQFKTPPPYEKGRGVGLPTPSQIPGTNVQSPTHGAKAIMERAKGTKTNPRSLAKWLDGFFRRHSKLSRYRDQIRFRDREQVSGRHGEARQHGDEVWVFPKFWGLPPGVQDSVMAHEIGHWVLSQYGTAKAIKQAYALGIDPWDTLNLPFGQFNMDEAFADSFASYYTDGDVRRRYPAWTQLVEMVQSRGKANPAKGFSGLPKGWYIEVDRAPMTLFRPPGPVTLVLRNSSRRKVGFIRLRRATSCGRAWEVTHSQAQRGWGPLLYDLALEFAGKHGVIPDRSGVSASATRVWTHYLKHRPSEVVAHPLDDDYDAWHRGVGYDVSECKSPGDEQTPLDYRYVKRRSTLTPMLKAAGQYRIGNPRDKHPGARGGNTDPQSLLFPIDTYTKKQAKRWARDQGFLYGTVERTRNFWRIVQVPGSHFKKFRTIMLPDTDGPIEMVVGILHPRKRRRRRR